LNFKAIFDTVLKRIPKLIAPEAFFQAKEAHCIRTLVGERYKDTDSEALLLISPITGQLFFFETIEEVNDSRFN
jgi:hypothetical protein